MKQIDSKYTKIYYNIISNAKSKQRKKSKDTYFESHHIIPRSLGGDNSKDNLVLLTAREHYVCHWLLIKFLVGEEKAKMIYAFKMFNNKKNTQVKETYFNSRGYEFYKKQVSEIIVSEEIREKMRKAKLGKPSTRKNYNHSKETIEKMKKAKLGSHRTEKTKNKISQFQKTQKRSEETRRKMALSKFGNKTNLGKIYITDGVNNKVINKDTLIPENWKIGRTKNVSIETKEKMRRAISGRICITNGIENRFIHKNQLIPQNWKIGKTKK